MYFLNCYHFQKRIFTYFPLLLQRNREFYHQEKNVPFTSFYRFSLIFSSLLVVIVKHSRELLSLFSFSLSIFSSFFPFSPSHFFFILTSLESHSRFVSVTAIRRVSPAERTDVSPSPRYFIVACNKVSAYKKATIMEYVRETRAGILENPIAIELSVPE